MGTVCSCWWVVAYCDVFTNTQMGGNGMLRCFLGYAPRFGGRIRPSAELGQIRPAVVNENATGKTNRYLIA